MAKTEPPVLRCKSWFAKIGPYDPKLSAFYVLRVEEYNVGIEKGEYKMVQIVATDELAKQLENLEGIVVLIDAKGNRLGTLTCPPTAEDVRIAKERRSANRPGMTTDELVSRLGTIESE